MGAKETLRELEKRINDDGLDLGGRNAIIEGYKASVYKRIFGKNHVPTGEELFTDIKYKTRRIAEKKTHDAAEGILKYFTGFLPGKSGAYANQKIHEWTLPGVITQTVEDTLKGYYGGASIRTKRYGEIRDEKGDSVTDKKGNPAIAYFSGNDIQITAGEDMEKALGEDFYKSIFEKHPNLTKERAKKIFVLTQLTHEMGEKSMNYHLGKETLTDREHAIYEYLLVRALKNVKDTYIKQVANEMLDVIAEPLYNMRKKAGQAISPGCLSGGPTGQA